MKTYRQGFADGCDKCEGTILHKLRIHDLAVIKLKSLILSEILRLITFGAHKSLLQKEYEEIKNDKPR